MYYSWIFVRTKPFLVRETAADPYGVPCDSSRWPEDELARIRVVLRRLSSLRVANAEDAEDLVQETLLTMTARMPAIELQKGLLVWSLGILRNKVGNYYRRARRTTPVTGVDVHDGLSVGTRSMYSPESRVHHAELRALITGMLKKLSPGERKAVQLSLAGFSTCEIAARLHPESYQTVANWLHRGRKKLIRELARFGYYPRRSRRGALPLRNRAAGGLAAPGRSGSSFAAGAGMVRFEDEYP